MQSKLLLLATLLVAILPAAQAQPTAGENSSADVRELLAQASQQASPPSGQQGPQLAGQPVGQVSVQPAVQLPPDPDRPVFNFYEVVARLAREMGKEFIVDPRIRTQSLGWATSGDQADFETLQAVLRSNGFATIEVGDQVRIVPEATARSEPSPIVQQDDSRISDHAVVTRIIEVADFEYTNSDGTVVSAAAQLVPVLRPMMSTAIGNITAIPGNNKVIIVDRYDNVRRITAIIDELRP